MRILFLVHQFMPDFAGGTEQVTLNLAKAAQSDGHRVEVLTVSAPERTGWRERNDGLRTGVVKGVPVTAFRRQAEGLVELGFISDMALAHAMRRFLDAREPFDLVHVTHAFRMTEAVELLAELRIPYVVTLTDFFGLCFRINLVRIDGRGCAGPRAGEACATYCGVPGLAAAQHDARVRRYASILRRASAVTAVSEFVAHAVKAELPDLRVRVVGHGVDLLRFPPPERRASGGPLTFGYLGTVSEQKGARLLVEAFAKAAPVEARLRLVGPCYDDELLRRIEELSCAADIAHLGPTPAEAAPAALAEFDLLCVPSQVPESFCLALHEGFAAGLPALVSDLGNLRDVMATHGCGLALPAADVEAWASAIQAVAAEPSRIAEWARTVPLPRRVEEEGFIYSQLYRAAAAAVTF